FQIAAGQHDALGSKRIKNKAEHYFFLAFEVLRRTPIFVGKGPTKSDVQEYALKLWATDRLRDRGISIDNNLLKLSPEEDDFIKKDAAKLKKSLPPRIWK